MASGNYPLAGSSIVIENLAGQLCKAGVEVTIGALLFTRFLLKDELAALLNSADVFMLPMATMSFVDLGLPTKVFEYQAYGKPIICVSNGEAARYVESTRSGLIIKPKDAGGFAEAIIRLYRNRKLITGLGRNGRQYVIDNLTAEKTGERMYDVLFFAKNRFVV